MKHLALLSLVVLVGFFRVVKSCSHGDDVVRAGKYTKNLDDFHYTKSYNSAANYGALTYIENLEGFAKNAKTEIVADKLVAKEIGILKPELKSELEGLEKIDDKFRKKVLFESLKKEKLSEQEFDKFQNISKSLNLSLKLKDFYGLDGILKANEHNELNEDTSYKFQNFKVRIPKGFYNLKYLKNSIAEGFWSNGSAVITVLKPSENKQKLLFDWQNFKTGKNLRDLTIINNEGNTFEYQLSKGQFLLKFGKTKIVQEGGKFMVIDLEYGNHEDYKKNADLLLRML